MPRIARWVTLVAALTLVPIGPVFAAQTVPPTVTFNRWGACGSRPDVHELTVADGTQIRVINRTHVDATLVVDNEDVTDLPDGGETLLTLLPGQHAVTMLPSCQPTKNIAASTVTVTAAAPSKDPAPATVPSAEATPTGSPSEPKAATPDAAATQADTGGRQLPRLLAVVASIFLIGVVAAIARVVVRAGRSADHEPRSTAQVALDAPQQRTDDEAANYVRRRLRELVQAGHRGADPRQVEAEREELFARYSPDVNSDTQSNLDHGEAEMNSPEPPGTGAPDRTEPHEPTSPVL
jgi:hypothetical protein